MILNEHANDSLIDTTLCDFENRKWTNINPRIPTTIKTMGVNITTIAYLRVLIIEIGSTIIFGSMNMTKKNTE